MKPEKIKGSPTQRTTHYDFVIVGAGFAGSLAALMLRQSGFHPCLIEKDRHPRFAIGESSTPGADMILRNIATSYNLPWLADLSRYGSWQKRYPNITCGIKRGFSYYHHTRGELFRGDSDHSRELLVAASENDLNSDTHWLREDVDNFLTEKVREMGIPYYDNTTVAGVRSQSTLPHARTGDGANLGTDPNTDDRAIYDTSGHDWTTPGKNCHDWTTSSTSGIGPGFDSENSRQWTLELKTDNTRRDITTHFIIDATGGPAFSTQFFGAELIRDGFKTRSMALFSHFKETQTWFSQLQKNSCPTHDYPFNPDHAALHHLIDEGWFWMLRFNNNLLSAGAVLDLNSLSPEKIQDTERFWGTLLERYPSLRHCFSDAHLAETPGRLYQTGQLQRRLSNLIGEGWVALNNSAGFIEPLHSTGIAHTLAGLEKVIAVLVHTHKDPSKRLNQLREHERDFFSELTLIDNLVASCYLTRSRFPLFTACTMLYFTCVIDYESRRLRGELPAQFLSADNGELVSIVTGFYNDLQGLMSKETSSSDESGFIEKIRAKIAPYNTAGLLDGQKKNMYRHTAVSL